ncbi:hypothetical protein RJ639_015075 [Escallonia herrerae]|uniref:Uncharacterized protein n=1 Tax=Escallonia herrerae TaxID=1293975 RepID=A0AA88VM18_9ASTE|nr:hypothetical protein RJ639_015075 [Escallonia herrerae]
MSPPAQLSSLRNALCFKSPRLPYAIAESDSPKSLDPPDPEFLLQELKLNDAAFDLSNGPVLDECGQELGETLLNIARAWEQADTSTSGTLVSMLPLLFGSLRDDHRSGKPLISFGKRLLSAGRRFQSMGQYGQGELQKIAKAMIATGKLLSSSSTSKATNEEVKQEARMLKFGELQVELTPEKAYIGAAIAFVFGILSWEVGQGIQSTPESSLQYANDNALLLAKLGQRMPLR